MSNRKVMLEFDVSDLPMLASALRTAACEAMMSSRPLAQARLGEYRATIDRLIPEPARIFGGTTWAEICISLADAKCYSVGFEEWGYDWGRTTNAGQKGHQKYGRIYVAIGDKRWGSYEYRHFRNDGAIEAVRDLVAAMAPFDCEHIPVKDTKAPHLAPPPARAQDDDEASGPSWNP